MLKVVKDLQTTFFKTIIHFLQIKMHNLHLSFIMMAKLVIFHNAGHKQEPCKWPTALNKPIRPTICQKLPDQYLMICWLPQVVAAINCPMLERLRHHITAGSAYLQVVCQDVPNRIFFARSAYFFRSW